MATAAIVFAAIDIVQARPFGADYDFPTRTVYATPRMLDSTSESLYAHGYLRAQGCVSYTISLDDSEYQQNLGVSVVGQETFVFFEYTLPYNIVADDYYTDDDDDDDDGDDDTYRRHLDKSVIDGSYGYYNYYGSNSIRAKDWLVAFSESALNKGCIEMKDEMRVFRDAVPAIYDDSISFSNLYYGPICASNDSNSTNLEMGVFLDSSCNAYIPGLSQVLNEMILPEWTKGVSFRGNDRQTNSSSANGTDSDLDYLDSYKTLLHQLNYYSNHDTTNCASESKVCQEITEASVDLNTCQSLASELWKVGNGDYASNTNDDDTSTKESAYVYGEFFRDSDDNGEEYYHYRMFKSVLEDYSDCASTHYDNDDCTGWNYGWGQYDCNVDNNDGTSGNYNGDSDCQQGVCYGLLESFDKGYSLKKWLDSNARDLEYDMTHIYGVETPSIDFEYVLVAICGILMAFLVAMAFWTEGILRSFSKRRSMERK